MQMKMEGIQQTAEYELQTNNFVQLKGKRNDNKPTAPHHQRLKIPSENRQQWFTYLPNESKSYHLSSKNASKDEKNCSTYRKSLEKKLQKLFKQEKNLLLQRHFQQNSNDQLQPDLHHKQQQKVKIFDYSHPSNIFEMEKKVKKLEQKYLGKTDTEQTQKKYKKNDHSQERKKNNHSQIIRQFPSSHKIKKNDLKDQNLKKINSNKKERYKPEKQKLQIEKLQQINKQKDFLEEISQLRIALSELREANLFYIKKLEHREKKKDGKKRSKQLLKQIIQKLDMINHSVEIVKKQKKKLKCGNQIEKQTIQLQQQFQDIKQLLRKQEDERDLLEQRHLKIEQRISQIATSQEALY